MPRQLESAWRFSSRNREIPRELELDDLDAEASHVLAFDGKTPVATGRVTIDGRMATIARIAVLPGYRGQGIGARIVGMLEERARQRSATVAELSPHYYLEDFYARLGYRRVAGEEWVAGHRLIKMSKEL
ncbi:MAG: GNAT family N-acetyltransferase [Halomonas sp.]|uniref:GNAT family N-acetyltransferase n=1 Tax=Halomonas sp. TaxID=1486246 RepID=UPI002ACED7F1|nr:GNAT family N-acetyltransferase [Halomonas sp.]MDZ7852565.1 GNAT family N-acetyltransferase [Halomonas sp.]